MPAHATSSSTQAGPTVAGQKLVNLALQGVGSHGAFTWGALDRLLEDERLALDGISATSAGAVNAVVLAYGMAIGGREGAKKSLDRYWRRLSEMASASIFQPSLLDKMYGNFGLDHSPGYVFTDTLSQVFAPYQLNPLNYNPFKQLLEEVVDFEVLRRQSAVKLFLCATNVRSGKVKIFRSDELRSDHVVASSCQPLMMHAVEIDGEYYWDGGFIGNPALFPVIYACQARDIILVRLTPTERRENPTTPRAILGRMQEVTFNSSVMREMRVVAFLTKLIDDGKIVDGKRMLIHAIDGEDVIGALANSSKLNGDWDFLRYLYKIGRERADEWLKSNFDRLGVETTIDLQSKYL
ncbi:MAG: patatin-like phospholipase family protein [Candidatus Acidiferrales bacterium]